MIEERRSIRKFKGESVSKQHIETIVEAARLAPSAKNRQPWKYIVYTGQKQNALLDVMESALKKEQAEHSSLPNSGFGLPDAFNTLPLCGRIFICRHGCTQERHRRIFQASSRRHL